MTDETCEETFLAEKVIDSGFGQQDGKRYYKIKWVRYTWESEDALTHLKDLLDIFWSEHKGSSVNGATRDHTELIDNINQAQHGIEEIITVNDLTVEVAPIEDPDLLKKDPTIVDCAIHNDVSLNDAREISTNADEDATALMPIPTSNFSIDKTGTLCPLQEKLTCDTCLESFNSLHALRTHTRARHTEKSFQCEHCQKSFSERSTLKRHMFIHLEEKPFKCEHCERAFSDKSTLRRHIITHTGHKRFHCKHCNKRFTRNEHLRQHNYIHTAEKLYKCDTCFKDFRQRSTLKNHMLLHRARGQLTCKGCGTVFTQQIHLDKHVPWCTGVPPEGLKCEFCDERFDDHNGLKHHQGKHRSKQCTLCNVSFEEHSALQKHMSVHREGKPFQCTLCLKEFSHNVMLIEHVSQKHSDQLILEILQPNDCGLDSGILMGEELDTSVNYILQDNLSGEVMNREVEVCMGKNHMDISSDECLSLDLMSDPNSAGQEIILSLCPTTAHEEGAAVPPIGGQDSLLTLNKGEKKSGEDTAKENELTRIQIVRTEDGENIIQSVETITPVNKVSSPENMAIKELTVSGVKAAVLDKNRKKRPDINILPSENVNDLESLSNT